MLMFLNLSRSDIDFNCAFRYDAFLLFYHYFCLLAIRAEPNFFFIFHLIRCAISFSLHTHFETDLNLILVKRNTSLTSQHISTQDNGKQFQSGTSRTECGRE